MPRFVQSKYKVEQDSSVGHHKRAHELGAVVLTVNTRGSAEEGAVEYSCPCGCGEFTANPRKTHFKMGHDARLRGILIRAHLMDARIVYVVDGTEAPPATPFEVAERYGDSFTNALRKAEVRRETVNREVLHSAMNSKRLIKVGRWEHTGQVVAVYETDSGEEYDIEYVTKKGEKKRTRVAAADAPAAKEAA